MNLDDDKIRQLAQMNGLKSDGPVKEVAAALLLRMQGLMRAVEAPASRFAWPEPPRWLDWSKMLVIEPQNQRPANPDEMKIAEYLRNKWNALTADYRFRFPMPNTGGYVSVTHNMNCLTPFIAHGDRSIGDLGVSPVSGDVVLVKWCDETVSMLDYFDNQFGTDEHRQKSAAGRGFACKIYCRIDGRDVLLNNKQGMLLGDSQILGVVRSVERDGVPMYYQ